MFQPWSNPAMWHAMNVHLPIVLVMLGLPAVGWVAVTRGRSRSLRWGVVGWYALATLSAWFAAETGERAIDMLPNALPQAAWDRINFHEDVAEVVWIFAAATTFLLLLANIPRRWARQTFTTMSLIASVVTLGWVMVTAHSGGVAVYDHGLGTVAMHAPVGADLAATTAPAAAPTTRSAPVTPIATSVVSYKRDIKPLLALKCAKCHSDHDLQSEFDVSTVAAMLKGGKKAGAAVIAGKPDDSPLVKYLDGRLQPQMPKKAKALDPAEIAMIRAWIAAGALDDSNGPLAPPVAPLVAATPTTPAAPTAPAAPLAAAVVPSAGTATSPPPTPATNAPSTASAATAPAVAADASAAATTAPAPGPIVTEAPVSEDWDPQVQFGADEAVAVRRYVRMKNLKPAPAPPANIDAPLVYNPIDRFIVAKYPATQQVASASPNPQAAASATQPTSQPVSDDATFARRVYLDLIGVIPTADEARKFVEDKDERKREKLVDALLGRTKEYAGHWVPFWEDALTSNGQHQGGVGTHGSYRKWAFDNFERNKPYDTIVQELIDPSMPNHPGRYILNDNHTRTVQSASDVAQVFLGTAIKCASCHSHFLNDEWPQKRAVAFSGYFAQKDMELVRCERSTGEFVQTHFMFHLPAAPTSAPADQGQRLKRVAQLITDPTNPRFAKTIVNRLWKRYMGLGLFEPADDFRQDTPPSHPELLDWLADDFIRHGYDVKHTVRLILTSRTYQLRYDAALEDKFDVEKPGAPRFYRSPGLRRLTAEQLLDSIAMTTGQKIPEKRAYQDDNSTPLTRSLGKPAARNEVSTQRPDDTAVVQALELLNGPEFHDRVYKGEQIDALTVQPDLGRVVDDLYWSAFSRAPSEGEKSASIAFLKAAPKPATTQPVEVTWVEDAIPTRAKPQGAWKFVSAPDAPVFSGKSAHTEAEPFPGVIQHLFTGVNQPVAPGDILFAYAYIEPGSEPKELMLQFHYNGDWHRAAWGEKQHIEFAPKNTLGMLPKAGEWVRLEVPAIKIGIDKPGVVTGVAFTQFGGKVYWDKTGAAKGPPVHDPATIGDMLWALVASPEFQYVK